MGIPKRTAARTECQVWVRQVASRLRTNGGNVSDTRATRLRAVGCTVLALMETLLVSSETWLTAALVALAVAVLLAGTARGGGPRVPGTSAQTVLLLVVSLAAVLLPLFGAWIGGRTHPNAIAGLIPWNDAAGYYGCTLDILGKEDLSPFCQRRPFYTVYLSGLLAAAGLELQRALVLQALMSAAGVFIVASVALRRWGIAPALGAVAILSAFVATMSMTTLTENIGFLLGTVALVLLFAGAERGSRGLLALGAFALCLALNARAGAFLVLPLLVLWPLLFQTDKHGGRGWAGSLVVLVAVVAGFVPGIVMTLMLGGATGETHSNLSYTLYGLVAGGERWTYAVAQLPGAKTSEIYAAAWHLFLESPLLLVAGLVQGFLEYLQRLLTYVPWLPARIALALCWLWGLAGLFGPGRPPSVRLLGWLMLGVVASSPILSIDGDTRVYAATTALDGLIVAFGLARLARAFRNRRTALAPVVLLAAFVLSALVFPEDPRLWGGMMILGMLIGLLAQLMTASDHVATARGRDGVVAAMLVFIVAIGVSGMFPLAERVSPGADTVGSVTARLASERLAAETCGTETSVLMRPGADSPVVKLVGPGQSSVSPLAVTLENFRGRLHPLTHQYAGLYRLPAGTALVFAHDLSPSRAAGARNSILVGDADIVPADGRLYLICLENADVPGLEDVRRIRSVYPLP
jgi:hypothetical protein